MKKKKTVKTRILSLFLILLLLTGSVSGVHAEEAAGAEAAGSETTKEQVVESGDSSGSGDQGNVPESTGSTVPQMRRKTKRPLQAKMCLLRLL